MTWICASCGAEHETNDPPCRECAAEQFAKLDARQQSPDRVDSGADLVWRCTTCGRDHRKNNPPCSKCGSMQLGTVPSEGGGTPEALSTNGGSSSATTSSRRTVTGVKIVAYLFGIQALALSIGYAYLSLAGSVLFALSGVIAMPVSRGLFEERFNLDFSWGGFVIATLVAYFLALGLMIAAYV